MGKTSNAILMGLCFKQQEMTSVALVRPTSETAATDQMPKVTVDSSITDVPQQYLERDGHQEHHGVPA